jgi:hypothetical protein
VAVRSKASVCGHSMARIVDSNPAEGIDVQSLVSVVCRQVADFATSLSLVQRIPIARARACVCVCVRARARV